MILLNLKFIKYDFNIHYNEYSINGNLKIKDKELIYLFGNLKSDKYLGSFLYSNNKLKIDSLISDKEDLINNIILEIKTYINNF